MKLNRIPHKKYSKCDWNYCSYLLLFISVGSMKIPWNNCNKEKCTHMYQETPMKRIGSFTSPVILRIEFYSRMETERNVHEHLTQRISSIDFRQFFELINRYYNRSCRCFFRSSFSYWFWLYLPLTICSW